MKPVMSKTAAMNKAKNELPMVSGKWYNGRQYFTHYEAVTARRKDLLVTALNEMFPSDDVTEAFWYAEQAETYCLPNIKDQYDYAVEKMLTA